MELLNALDVQSTCMQDALLSTPYACTDDPAAQSLAAIKLALCELQIPQASLPKHCNDEIDIQNCLAVFKSVPQWWTSYSANLNSLNGLCIRNLPFSQARTSYDALRNITQYLLNLQSLIDQLSLEQSVLVNSSTHLIADSSSALQLSDESRSSAETVAELLHQSQEIAQSLTQQLLAAQNSQNAVLDHLQSLASALEQVNVDSQLQITRLATVASAFEQTLGRLSQVTSLYEPLRTEFAQFSEEVADLSFKLSSFSRLIASVSRFTHTLFRALSSLLNHLKGVYYLLFLFLYSWKYPTARRAYFAVTACAAYYAVTLLWLDLPFEAAFAPPLAALVWIRFKQNTPDEHTPPVSYDDFLLDTHPALHEDRYSHIYAR
ncbi:hypothetical protein CANCADRAFT_1268 [Tortispora caseinolytica NRRL Y-17796]|uniref:Nuclear fusion protein KAR5 n=1 Tax=Tortispora caseinolytica NRRL Y-17796 TaxID=767744 RepID=A0A1E4TLQ0_9ASCO|nr:hypothetical protein CANCADRAFT_1268 [Tortispora caseinolytica NRRL Y-17796]